MKQKWNVNNHPVGTEIELISSSSLYPMESVIVEVQWKNKGKDILQKIFEDCNE